MLLKRRRKVTWTELVDELSGMVCALPPGCKEIAIPQKADIFDLMRCYTADPQDFSKYLHFNKSGYAKVLFRELPRNAGNIILMCWGPGQMSGIHAHEGSRCFVKVLAGLLKEERYTHPANRPDGVSILGETVQIRGTTWRENDVAYIDDSMGCHRVTNQSSRQPAVTMHIYVPPYRRSRLFELDHSTNKITLERSRVFDVTFDRPGDKPACNLKDQEVVAPKQEREAKQGGGSQQEDELLEDSEPREEGDVEEEAAAAAEPKQEAGESSKQVDSAAKTA